MTPLELWTANTGLAYSLARRRHRVQPWLDCDDLRQAALLALWVAAGKWEPNGEASFSSFAWHFVRGAVVREGQRLDRQRSRAALPAEPEARPEGPSPEDRELAAFLLAGVVGRSYRTAARLAWVEGCDRGEIARRMGMRKGSVYTRLHCALRQMRRIALPMTLEEC